MTVRKPTVLKLLAGTARADRVAPETPALPAVDAAPNPPAWMTNINAVAEWRRLAPILTACKLLTAGNISLLAQLCALHGRLVELWTASSTPAAALISAYRALCNEVGLSSMKLPAPADKPNRFRDNFKCR